MDTNRDLFNQVLSEKNKETMMKALERRAKKDVFNEVEKEIPTLVRNYVKSHIPKTLSKDEISVLIDEVVKKNTPKTVERIIEKPIEKTVIKQVERKDNGEIEALRKELESLKKLIKEKDKEIAVQYIGTMIPNFNGQDGTVLTARNGKIQWETGNSSGSGMPTNWTWEDDGTALVLKYNGTEAGRWPYPS